MRKIIAIFMMIWSVNLYAIDDSTAILKEIQSLREDMNKRFEQVDKRFGQIDKRFEQIDKRFEQVDRRFEQVDRRFEFIQNILYLLMGLIFASPFIAIYLRDKKDEKERESFENVKGILFVLRELAQDNEKVAKSLRAASLL